jgi:biopolymer transport protein ExbB
MNSRYLYSAGALVIAICAFCFAAPKRDAEAQQRELEVLKQYLQSARDSLQRDITDRWRQKQRFVEQREIDKEGLLRLREEQERAFNELSQAKEEVLAKQRVLEDERKAVDDTREEWEYVALSFSEVFEKESKNLVEYMPLTLEKRREDLEDLRRQYSTSNNPASMLPKILDYHEKYLTYGDRITISKQVVMPDEGEPAEMSVVRFGNIMAYAIDNSGNPYIIRQTGKLGAARYTIEPVQAPELQAFLQEKLPVWVDNAEIESRVAMDVMQNSNSGILISGNKVKVSTRLTNWLKAGGPVMIPLLLLLAWALALIVMKLFQYSRKDRVNRDLYDNVVKMLKRGETEQAHKYADSHKGVVAKVVSACLAHSKWNRNSAEKAVREILLDEVPQLDKSLATLAVIAGAAPLLGLLGTVTGMINLFEVITHYGTGDPKILAGGISEALITTQTGLAVAIPILLVHNFLRNRSLHIQSEMGKSAIRILNRLWPETDQPATATPAEAPAR